MNPTFPYRFLIIQPFSGLYPQKGCEANKKEGQGLVFCKIKVAEIDLLNLKHAIIDQCNWAKGKSS